MFYFYYYFFFLVIKQLLYAFKAFGKRRILQIPLNRALWNLLLRSTSKFSSEKIYKYNKCVSINNLHACIDLYALYTCVKIICVTYYTRTSSIVLKKYYIFLYNSNSSCLFILFSILLAVFSACYFNIIHKIILLNNF